MWHVLEVFALFIPLFICGMNGRANRRSHGKYLQISGGSMFEEMYYSWFFFLFFFFPRGKKVKFPWTWLGTRGKWTSFVRISFHERWSFEARVHRSTFHSEYLRENSSEFSDSNEPRHSARHVERGLIRCLEYRIASTHTLKILADKINTLIYLYIYIYIAPFLKSLADCHFSILYLVAF